MSSDAFQAWKTVDDFQGSQVTPEPAQLTAEETNQTSSASSFPQWREGSKLYASDSPIQYYQSKFGKSDNTTTFCTW
ncbi:hypothetical protein BGZ79_004038 [Entomortierella chlamydospora]|nr:hypothetical protein BGZ79_004038 [Entomortierella chlamydospora]